METEISIIKKMITALVSRDDLECICSLCELLGRIKAQFTLQQSIVEEVKQYIEEHASEKLTLELLAHQFHLHPVYLQRKFKKKTGLTPANYQKKARISKAKAYLLTTDLSIEEISDRCGFCNPSYFIDVFKGSEQITPFQFKQRTNLAELSC